MKKILSAALTLAMTLSLLPAAFAAGGTAYASTQAVEVDGKKVEFQMYALKDANGNPTNYVKLRDVAHVLNGTKAQFAVGYDGSISVTTGTAYTDVGGEMSTPYSGDRTYRDGSGAVKVNGQAASLESIILTDDAGGDYTYFKLRDLGAALGFKVDWDARRGVIVETGGASAGQSAARTITTLGYGYSYDAVIDENSVLWAIDFPNEGGYIKMMENVVSVSCDRWNMLALDANGILWQWGYCMGEGDFYRSELVMDHVASFDTGLWAAVVVKTDGTVWTLDLETKKYLPVAGLEHAVSVSCGEDHFAAILEDGSLWLWGSNQFGQIGNNGQGDGIDEFDNLVQNKPVKVMDHVASVSCGIYATAALQTDGSLWTWGSNEWGQLGNGHQGNASYEYEGLAGTDATIYQTVPVKIMDDVVCASMNSDCSVTSCGGGHGAAVKQDGTLWCWGMNGLNQLGNGGGGNLIYDDGLEKSLCQTTPVQIAEGVWAAVSVQDCTYAVKQDGTVLRFGETREAPEELSIKVKLP